MYTEIKTIPKIAAKVAQLYRFFLSPRRRQTDKRISAVKGSPCFYDLETAIFGLLQRFLVDRTRVTGGPPKPSICTQTTNLPSMFIHFLVQLSHQSHFLSDKKTRENEHFCLHVQRFPVPHITRRNYTFDKVQSRALVVIHLDCLGTVTNAYAALPDYRIGANIFPNYVTWLQSCMQSSLEFNNNDKR